ncbi:MAG: hypothetical protein QOH67_2426 [Hyphomicrobiales bacterium]|jgi:hypothetical protein|nr:hypothetical protein [Hyphomicrobiales bacterium]
MKTRLATRSRSDQATQDDGKVRLGDFAPAFDTFDTKDSSRQPMAQTKQVARDAATEDGGKVRLGDFGPAF